MNAKETTLDELIADELKHLRESLEAIQNVGRRAAAGHDADCTCATCLLTQMATQALA